jgi:adenine-specific DNA methylase
MQEVLSKYGRLETKEIDYIAFRGGRQAENKSKRTTEYLLTLKKG